MGKNYFKSSLDFSFPCHHDSLSRTEAEFFKDKVKDFL